MEKLGIPARTAAFFRPHLTLVAVRASGVAGKTSLRDPGKRGARVLDRSAPTNTI